MYGADAAIQFLKEFHFSGTATTPIRSFFNSLMEYLYHRDVLAPPVFSNNGDNVPLVIPPTHNSFHAGASHSGTSSIIDKLRGRKKWIGDCARMS
ncbi:hypothetical protein T01_11186 [Trichinella spiralis]|uniref:Uncharacterized protein n=1 Tax=Trichinella spiralis TaxID=6334 RepID=A0A0V1BP24_TRISP|nr:hypothetical protein T01_11186 [Trichinella spiralis]